MREVNRPSDESSEDAWSFVTERARPRRISESVAPTEQSADPGQATTGARLEDEFGESAMAQLRRRARPLAWSIAAVFVFGFITEVVAASRFVSQLGATALVIIYPVGSLCLLVVALLQITWIDRIPRDKAFTRVTYFYAFAFVVALALIANERTTVLGTGLVWLVADQLNFLLPLIVWAVVGDLFNAGEGRKVYPWLTSWQYGGQLLGLAIPALAPIIFVPLGIPLPALLIVCPIGILILGIALPRALRGRAFSRGHGRDEGLVESLSSAWQFVGGVRVFRAMFTTSVLVFIAGMTLEATYISSAERILADNAKLQMLYGATLVVVFAICWALQQFVTTKLLERFDIPGSLIVLPLLAAIAAAGLLLGVGASVLPVMFIAMVVWWVPRWSLDDVARRAALAVVPDEKRARVSFLVDLVPFASGLLVAGVFTAIGQVVDAPFLAPAVALPVALLAVVPARRMKREWQDALLDPRLRRRKRLSA